MTTLHHHSHYPYRSGRRLHVTCPLHPTSSAPPAAFCASCLRERLSDIDPNTLHEIPNPSAPRLRPDHLRRCRSYSVARGECGAVHASAEPRRRSCDSRSQSSTLSDLFTLDDAGTSQKVESLPQLKEESDGEQDGGEIRVDVVQRVVAREENAAHNGRFYEDDFGADMELKSMKEFIDLEVHSKKQPRREIRAFWDVASMFSERLTKWRWKEKMKSEKKRRECNGNDLRKDHESLDRGKLRLRETQSEVGEHGHGRRSCDTDPRLSLDACSLPINAGSLSLDGRRFSVDGGRIPMDVGRVSIDEPRASWDGYLIGGRNYDHNHHHHHQHYQHHNQRPNPMVSFLEDVKVIDSMLKNRAQVEEQLNVVDEGGSPGGSVQTWDYYKDCVGSQRRRRSFDWSNSRRKGPLLDTDELKSMSNAKVSPTTTELFYGAKLLFSERKLGDPDSKLTQEDGCRRSVDSASKSVMLGAGGNDPRLCKKFQKWDKVKSFWGMIQGKNKSSRCSDEGKIENGFLEDRAVPDAWQTPYRVSFGGVANEVIESRLARSCSVSARNSSATAVEARCMRSREECGMQRNQSIKYSSSNADNGLLRFYLTPVRSTRSKSMKSRLRKAHALAKGAI
ncbi:hypothetical protein SAY87_013548 [Trapa incisa]|uniref:Uncharacterized protein n=1 Tax=Trapa incisa TaxID=236973 RepID=A0AAN7KJN9_9MYRT|nr:hypothetical protein SAY87_013548 [Trapa incisa]